MKTKHFLFFAAVSMLSVAACSKLSSEVEIPARDVPEQVQSGIWQVRINADKGAGTKALEFDEVNKKVLTSFKTTDLVYVYNKTKGALDAGILHPEADGASVTISGALSGSYSVGDVVDLRYGPYFAWDDGSFDYEEQTGDFETLRDFGIATVKVTAVDAASGILTLEDAHFANPYSIFKFTFVDADSGNPIPINFLWIKSVTGKLVFKESPDGTKEYYGNLADGCFPRENYRNDSTDPVWLALSYEQPAVDPGVDWMAFAILDEVHKIVYDMSRMTDGKISNGNFYAPTIEMMPLPKPSVTLTASGTPVEPASIASALYDVSEGYYYKYENPGSDITLSGLGDQCFFSIKNAGSSTVRFRTASPSEPTEFVCTETTFIEYLSSQVLTLDLDGDAKVWGGDDKALIKVDRYYPEVVFRGNGTLTLIASNSVGSKGFSLADGAGNLVSGAPDVHAAAGYTLVVSEGSDNGDGTSTWTYTVFESSSMLNMTLPPSMTFSYAGNPVSGAVGTGGNISFPWKVGDQLWINYDGAAGPNQVAKATVNSVDGSGNAQASVSLTNPTEGTYMMIGAPFSHWNDGIGLQSGQDGTLQTIGEKHSVLMCGSNFTVSGSTIQFSTALEWMSDATIWEMSFTDGTQDITGGITYLIVKCGEYDNYYIYPKENQSSIYVALYPQIDTEITITAYTNGGRYLTTTGALTLEEGKHYISKGIALTKV